MIYMCKQAVEISKKLFAKQHEYSCWQNHHLGGFLSFFNLLY